MTGSAHFYAGSWIASAAASLRFGHSSLDDFDPEQCDSRVPLEWARDFIARNPKDYHRLYEAYSSGQAHIPSPWPPR